MYSGEKLLHPKLINLFDEFISLSLPQLVARKSQARVPGVLVEQQFGNIRTSVSLEIIVIDVIAINGKRHRRNLKDIYIIVKLSHDLSTLKMSKSHFFYQSIL